MPDLIRAHLWAQYFIVLVLLAASLIVGLLVVDYSAVSEALTPYFTKDPAQLTVLYFTDYGSMPKILNAGSSYTFDYTLVNHENRDRTYAYRVTAVEDSKATILDSGEISLKDGARAVKKFVFTPTTPGTKDEIIVDLPDKNQRITFSAQNNW